MVVDVACGVAIFVTQLLISEGATAMSTIYYQHRMCEKRPERDIPGWSCYYYSVNARCFNDPPHNNSWFIWGTTTNLLGSTEFFCKLTVYTQALIIINATFGWSSCSFAASVRSSVGKEVEPDSGRITKATEVGYYTNNQ